MGYIRIVNSTGNGFQELYSGTYFLNKKIWLTSLAVIYIEKKVQLKSKNKEITRIEYSVLT